MRAACSSSPVVCCGLSHGLPIASRHCSDSAAHDRLQASCRGSFDLPLIQSGSSGSIEVGLRQWRAATTPAARTAAAPQSNHYPADCKPQWPTDTKKFPAALPDWSRTFRSNAQAREMVLRVAQAACGSRREHLEEGVFGISRDVERHGGGVLLNSGAMAGAR